MTALQPAPGPAARGRPNQRQRTRKDLLDAATRLTRDGRRPTLDEVAVEAMVSRATAYRYFQSIDALMVEAALDVAMPTAETVFAHGVPADPASALAQVDDAMAELVARNEPQFRTMLAASIQRGRDGPGDDGVPPRQNRRTPLIEAALDQFPGAFPPDARRRLAHALAIVMGGESMVVTRDVLQLDDAEARELRHWMIRTLADASRRAPTVDSRENRAGIVEPA